LYYCYGQVRSQNGSSPTAFDPNFGFTIFTASECPVEIVAGSYYGGVADKYYHVGIVPPQFSSGDVIDSGSGYNQIARIINTGSAASTPFTENLQGNIMQPERLTASNTKWIVPPYHSVVVSVQEPTTGVFTVNLLGMDLVKPGESKYA